jgi:hypothetical protein
MRRTIIILLTTITAVTLGIAASWSHISFYMLTGRFSPIHKIESLQNPIAVTSWSRDGLHLADGRTVQLPGFRSLPTNSPTLTEATKRGVEIRTDGRIWGLVKIHHWCGDDPVREHIAKVDLSDMMIYLRVGEPVTPMPAESLASEPGGRFTEYGWNASEFLQFQAWQSTKDFK